MGGRRSIIRTDGRVRLRVDLPADVLAAADRIVEDTGLDRESVLGDLAAAALPAVLAEAAEQAVGSTARSRLGNTPKTDSAPGLPEADPRPVIAKRQVTPIVQLPGGPKKGPGGGVE